jgi:hypothetical protein
MDLRTFSRRITAIAERVEPAAQDVVRKTALAVDQTVVMATPVDTGRARVNWQVQAGAMPSDVVPPYAPGAGGSTAAQNTQAALEQGKIAISGAQPGQEIHITNNLPYIGRLNEGHSAQAPAGFVEQAVNAGIETIRQARLIE